MDGSKHGSSRLVKGFKKRTRMVLPARKRSDEGQGRGDEKQAGSAVEIGYESKGEARGDLPLSDSEEGWIRRDRDSKMRVWQHNYRWCNRRSLRTSESDPLHCYDSSKRNFFQWQGGLRQERLATNGTPLLKQLMNR